MKTVDGVTAEIAQPVGLSNKTPSLRVRWDRAKLGVGGPEVVRALFTGEPRITMTASGGGDAGDRTVVTGTGVSITPYMMAEGDAPIIADRLHAVLSKPPITPVTTPAAPTADLSGGWDVKIQYAASASTHRFQLRQKGAEIEGSHQGDFITRDLTGSIDGDAVRLRSNVGEEGGDAFSFQFTGKVAGDQLTGTLDMAEYLGATFTATRRAGGRRRA